VSKIGKIFSNLPVVLAGQGIASLLSKKKKKTVFVNLAPKVTTPTEAAIPTSDAEVGERRRRIASKLKRGGRTGAFVDKINNEDDEDVIRRAAARKAKLLGG